MKKTIAVFITPIFLAACSPQSVSVDYWTNKDVAGPDVDGNGIRDDVDEWIASQNFKPALDRAVKKEARMEYILTINEPVQTDAYLELIKNQMDAYDCVINNSPQYLDEPNNPGKVYEIIDSLRKKTLNTRERFIYDHKIGSVFSGHTWDVPHTPEEKAAACE